MLATRWATSERSVRRSAISARTPATDLGADAGRTGEPGVDAGKAVCELGADAGKITFAQCGRRQDRL